jgi:hypothetical protein
VRRGDSAPQGAAEFIERGGHPRARPNRAVGARAADRESARATWVIDIHVQRDTPAPGG